MEGHSSHRGLELRLGALAERIALLRHRMTQAQGVERIEKFGDIAELVRRHANLTERLHALDLEGPGLWPNVRAELEKIANDLSGTIEDFMMRTDAEYGRHARTKDGSGF